MFFQPEMINRGYDCKFHAKSRARTMDEYSSRSVDGCVICWKKALYVLSPLLPSLPHLPLSLFPLSLALLTLLLYSLLPSLFSLLLTYLLRFDCVAVESIEYQSLALKKHDVIGQAGMNRLLTKDNIGLVTILRPKGDLVFNPKAGKVEDAEEGARKGEEQGEGVEGA
jgi:hypothetical protein